MGSTRRFKENFLSLFGMQMWAYIVPLLLIPYLLSKIGLAHVGEIALAASICTLISLIVDYGFPLYGARQVSIANKDGNSGEVARVLFTVMQTKFLILGLITPVYVLAILKIHEGPARFVYLTSFLIVISQALATNWFFQGIERLRAALVYTVTIRTASVIIIVLTVSEPADYVWVPLIQGIASVIVSAWMLRDAFNYVKARHFWVRVRDVRDAVVEAAPLFGTSLMSSAISAGGTVILAASSHSNEILGVYSTYERVIRAAQSMFSPVTQALFPLSARLMATDIAEARKLMHKTLTILFTLATVAILIGYFVARFAVGSFGDPMLAEYSVIVLFFAPWFVAGICNNITGTQYLIAGGESSRYLRYMAIATVVTLVFQIGLVQYIGIKALPIGMSLGEAVLFVILLLHYTQSFKAQNKST